MTELADASSLARLWSGATWSEGPAWIATTGRLRWSDVVGNCILEFDATTGEVEEYAREVEYVNGRTLDLRGNVVQCSHGRRRVERDVAGIVTSIVDRFEGRRFNSPNDVVVASDGAIWFTDPPYGLRADGLEGHPGEQEYGGCFVFRFDEATGELSAEITDMVHPNGLAFSPGESLLYVADTSGPLDIRVYEVVDGRIVAGSGRSFAAVRPGASDGFRVDVEGRIWTSSEDSVQVLSTGGEVLAKFPVPEKVANVCFGGADGRDLFITATTSLYRLRTSTTGVGGRP
jgi:gluconolactonase